MSMDNMDSGGDSHDREFEAMTTAHANYLISTLMRRFRLPREDAEDAVQDALVKAWEAWGRGQFRGDRDSFQSTRSWLGTIATREVLSKLRLKGLAVERLDDNDKHMGREGMEGQAYLWLWELVRSMKPVDRDLLLGKFQQGLDCDELADMLGVERSNARIRGSVFRAMARLRERFHHHPYLPLHKRNI